MHRTTIACPSAATRQAGSCHPLYTHTHTHTHIPPPPPHVTHGCRRAEQQQQRGRAPPKRTERGRARVAPFQAQLVVGARDELDSGGGRATSSTVVGGARRARWWGEQDTIQGRRVATRTHVNASPKEPKIGRLRIST